MGAMAQLRVSVLATVALVLLLACTPDKRKPPPSSGSVEVTKELPKAGPVQKCDLKPEFAGPLRRAGKASVELAGTGGQLVLKDVPALCGPMYDRDSQVLQVRAGEGLLFEVCVDDGLVQVSSFVREAGARQLRSALRRWTADRQLPLRRHAP